MILRRRKLARSRRQPLSLSTGVAPDVPDDGIAVSDGRSRTDPCEAAIDSEWSNRLTGVLREAWEELTDKESVAVSFCYGHGWTQAACARVLGIGQARVSRVLDRALEKIRRRIEAVGIDDGEGRPARGSRLWNVLTEAIATQMSSGPTLPASSLEPPPHE